MPKPLEEEWSLAVSLSQPEKPLRHRIEPHQVKHWSKHWKVRPHHIQAAIEKVGNSVAAVEKELRVQDLIEGEKA